MNNTNQTNQNMSELQKEFEAWAKLRGMSIKKIYGTETVEYDHYTSQAAWEGWSAFSEKQNQPTREI